MGKSSSHSVETANDFSGAKRAVFSVLSHESWVSAKKSIKLPTGPHLAYVDFGDPEGKPLLLIHGFTDTSRTWSALAPYLPGRRLIAVDLRGHGNSSAPNSDYTLNELARDIVSFLTELKLGRVDIVGHSLGSLLAQFIAGFHPQSVNKVVLVGSGVRAPTKPGDWIWDNVMSLHFPLDLDGEFMNEWYANPLPVEPKFERASRQEAAGIAEHVWRSIVQSLSVTDLAPIQKLMEAKLMIVWGAKDQAFGRADQDALIAAHPDAPFLELEASGHNPHWDFPAAVGGGITRFLSEVA
jgi:pimeloyl-ACP methyl ester carboxylesterase